MKAKLAAAGASAALLFLIVVSAYGQTRGNSEDIRALIKQGDAALAQNRTREAAAVFQKAVDLDPSSATAHEGLGMALSREIMMGNVRPSNDLDAARRAENHLKQASDLSPSAPAPLVALSQLEAALAEHAVDAAEKSERYSKAQDLLKRVIDLKPGDAGLYLQLANLERDEFGPVIQQAKARGGKGSGPVLDANLRRTLQQQYGDLVNDAIANAKRASELNGNLSRPLLLISKLLQERAAIRDTPEQYSADMHAAEQWRLQFLSVGGHAGEDESSVER
jgi:tetratricopeptide (TPR) repeat protein